MGFDIRPCASNDELRRAFVIGHYFTGDPSDEDFARFASLLPHDRMFAAWDGDVAAGGAGSFPFALSAPGGRAVPAAGVTIVGVLPTHRRRGVLTALMRAQLDDVRRRGEPIACLWASETTIYGRFGYGIASWTAEIDLSRDHTAFVDGPARGRPRLVDAGTALATFPGIYDRVLAERPGLFTRRPEWWERRRLADPVHRRGGGGPQYRVLFEDGGEPVGYALYRVHQALAHGLTTGSLAVIEAMGVDPAATRAVWRYLLDVDWVARIRADNLPIDHPLLLLTAQPRHLGARVVDALWVRLVDVGAALSARGYADGTPVVFEVDDAFCPWNTGRWRLADGRCARTDDPADLAVPVAALGAAWLGGHSFRRLADAGRVTELRPGALARADRVFAAERAPWCAEVF